MTDQRKRALEALERRFAVAEVELRAQQQQKNKKRPHEEKDKASSDVNASSVNDSSSATSFSKTSPKKGKFTFSGHSSFRDVGVNDPTYLQIFHPVHENLLKTDTKIQNRGEGIVDKLLHEILQSGDSAQKYMQGSRSMKIDNWILLDNVVQGRGMSTGARLTAFQRHSKRSKKHMSMSQLRKRGALNLPQEFHKYEIYKPMHEMWKDYIKQLVKNVEKNQLAQHLLNAELHGAIILVAQCKIAAFTGMSGIMIRETAEAFGIITENNKFLVVPKKVSVFMLQVDCWKITLHGDQLCSRNMLA